MRSKLLRRHWDPGNLIRCLLLVKIAAPTKICPRCRLRGAISAFLNLKANQASSGTWAWQSRWWLSSSFSTAASQKNLSSSSNSEEKTDLPVMAAGPNLAVRSSTRFVLYDGKRGLQSSSLLAGNRQPCPTHNLGFFFPYRVFKEK